MIKKQIKEMKRNHPDLFRQFLFGIVIAMLSLLQIVVLIVVCVFS